MSEEIERLQRDYDLALSNATCYSMRNRGWDSAEHERLGRVLREKHLELENARLRARVDELEAENEKIRASRECKGEKPDWLLSRLPGKTYKLEGK